MLITTILYYIILSWVALVAIRGLREIREFFAKRFPSSEKHNIVSELVVEALAAADPERVVATALEKKESCIIVRKTGSEYCPREGVYVLGFGKASREMARGLLAAVGGAVRGGVVIAPKGMGGRVGPVEVLEGDHPIPGANTLESSRRLLEYAKSLPSDSLAIVLVSGGGSALFELPAPGISVEDIVFTTKELLRRGASIEELNAVRKHMSVVKGGRFLQSISSKRVLSLIISDVIGNRLDTIASGPTAPDETSFDDAVRVLKKYNLWSKVSYKLRELFERGARGEYQETLKPGNPVFRKVENVIVASNLDSLRAARRKALERKYRAVILSSRIRGEAREAAKILAAIMESIAIDGEPYKPPLILIAGGETTVTVRGSGVGGRNQELCLSLALELDGKLEDYAATCIGSDGVDGVSPAAGAVIDEKVVDEAARENISPEKLLEENDSYTFFQSLKRAIVTGYTGTNVNDFFIAYIG